MKLKHLHYGWVIVLMLATILFLGMIGGAIGPVLAGSTFDVTGSYRLAFLITVILCALAVILSLILLRYKARET